jgi:hypothetical protein
MRQRNSPIVFNAPNSKHQLRAKADTFDSGEFVLVALATARPVRIGVGVEISASRKYYVALEKDQFKIQNEIGYESSNKQLFQWNPETKVKDVWLYWDVDFFDRQQWREQHQWLCDKLEAFRRVLRPRITALLHAT